MATTKKATAEQVGEAISEVVEERTAQQPKKFMYVGPPTKTLPRYTIFEPDLPEFAKEEIEKCPALKELFIDPTKLTAAVTELTDPNSVRSMFFKKAEQYFNGEVNA